ncbi:MAG: hypothetical protein AAFV93_07200 [Chloroflexota bacterium]
MGDDNTDGSGNPTGSYATRTYNPRTKRVEVNVVEAPVRPTAPTPRSPKTGSSGRPAPRPTSQSRTRTGKRPYPTPSPVTRPKVKDYEFWYGLTGDEDLAHDIAFRESIEGVPHRKSSLAYARGFASYKWFSDVSLDEDWTDDIFQDDELTSPNTTMTEEQAQVLLASYNIEDINDLVDPETGELNIRIFMGGRYSNPNRQGPDSKGYDWVEENNDAEGYDGADIVIRYGGREGGYKWGQAEELLKVIEAFNILGYENPNIQLIGYSAGGDAAVMATGVIIGQIPLDSIDSEFANAPSANITDLVLLGTTMSGTINDMNTETNVDDFTLATEITNREGNPEYLWTNIIKSALENETRVYVVDDAAGSDPGPYDLPLDSGEVITINEPTWEDFDENYTGSNFFVANEQNVAHSAFAWGTDATPRNERLIEDWLTWRNSIISE